MPTAEEMAPRTQIPKPIEPPNPTQVNGGPNDGAPLPAQWTGPKIAPPVPVTPVAPSAPEETQKTVGDKKGEQVGGSSPPSPQKPAEAQPQTTPEQAPPTATPAAPGTPVPKIGPIDPTAGKKQEPEVIPKGKGGKRANPPPSNTPPPSREHTRGARPSTANDHENGRARQNQKYTDKKRQNPNWQQQ